MADLLKPAAWPDGKRFAFTVFDDPDGQSLETSRLVYRFLADLGFRTSIAVWPLGTCREPNSGGETCANPEYLEHLQRLAEAGFEIAWHNATAHTSTRAETQDGLDRFRAFFGHDPASMANHYNGEALYWGQARLSGTRRLAYLVLTGFKTADRHFGHVEGHPCFGATWPRTHPVLPQLRVYRSQYVADVSMDAVPRPAASLGERLVRQHRGRAGPGVLKAVADANQDRLEAKGGASIVYTHFGHGFVEKGRLRPEFRRLMERLRRKNGWFVPASTILDHLAANRGVLTLDDQARRALEWRWLSEKLRRGTS